MIELGILDLSAEGRRELAALIEKWAWAPSDSRVTVPKLSLSLLAPEEVRFHGSIDVWVVGPEMIGCDPGFIRTLRQQLPEKLIVSVLDSRTYSLGLVEQLGRLGIDDVLISSASSDEFFRRVLLLQRRVKGKQRGRLISVSSLRGGVGVTFIAAAIAEAWLIQQRRVCLVDCDAISQDLSRFLEVRPYVSEPLRLLLDRERVITAETVKECTQQTWSDEANLVCMPPPAGGDDTLIGNPQTTRAFIEVLETLQELFDVVVVDCGGLPSSALPALYQVSDEVVYVANRDPAGVVAHRQALLLVEGYARPDSQVTTIINNNSIIAASLRALKAEALVLPDRASRELILPCSPKAAGWPCSGRTPYQFLSRYIDELVTRETEASLCSRMKSSACISLLREWGAGFWVTVGRLCRLGSHDRALGKTEGHLLLESGRVSGLREVVDSFQEGDLVSRPRVNA